MSGQADPQDTPAPSVPENKPVPAPTPAEPKAETKGPKADDLPPEALKARLEREREAERKAIFAELGITDAKSGKEALEKFKQLEREKLSETERLQAERDELKAKAEKADSYAEVITTRAEAELGQLSAEQRQAVTDLAGDDPAQQLKVLTKLRASNLLGSKESPKPMPAPASTAPSDPSPKAGATVEQQQALSTYESLKTRNPIEAARYLDRNYHAISAARQHRSG